MDEDYRAGQRSPAAPPFRVGSVLGRSLALWWSSLGTLLAILMLVYAPLFLLPLAAQLAGVAPFGNFIHVREIADWLLGAVGTAAIIHAIFRRLRGERASLGSCLRVALRRLPSVIAASLLTLLAAMAPIVPSFLLVLLADRVEIALALTLPGALGTLFVASLLWVAVPAVVVERTGPLAALRRSRNLARGNVTKIALLILVTFLVLFVAAQSLASLAIVMAGGGLAIEVGLTILTRSLNSTLIAVGYYHLRRSQEGIDPDQLLHVFD